MSYPPPYPAVQTAESQPDYPAALSSLQHMDVDSLKVRQFVLHHNISNLSHIPMFFILKVL